MEIHLPEFRDAQDTVDGIFAFEACLEPLLGEPRVGDDDEESQAE